MASKIDWFRLDYRERQQQFASVQKQWIKEQVREHQTQDRFNKDEDQNYADQTHAITRMRGMLEDDNTMRKK